MTAETNQTICDIKQERKRPLDDLTLPFIQPPKKITL